MEKIVKNGFRDCTVILDGTECAVKFDSCYRAFAVRNDGASDIYISKNAGIVPDDDGVMCVKSGGSAVFAHMDIYADTVYLLGTGKAQIHAQNDTNNPFRSAPVGGGGGVSDLFDLSSSEIGVVFTYGGRTVEKAESDLSYVAYFFGSTWFVPMFVSDTVEGTRYSMYGITTDAANPDTAASGGSFEYAGKTWYFNCSSPGSMQTAPDENNRMCLGSVVSSAEKFSSLALLLLKLNGI